MAASIGIRIYRFDIRKRSSTQRVPFHSSSLSKSPASFIENFGNSRIISTQDNDRERSWYFSRVETDSDHIRGIIRYGTFGFESSLVDAKTNQKNYQRKTTDVEEIPLYFHFWAPSSSDFGLIAFQSFQGKSCITLVMTALKEAFEQENRDYIFIYRKLMPSDISGTVFSKAPVKRVKLIRKKAHADVADAYLNNGANEEIDIELSLCARRKKTLGSLEAIIGKMPSDATGVLEFSGMEFDEAVAEVRIGKSLRRVGIFGHTGDAGVIDVTENIERGIDGHPTYDSILAESTSLISDFYNTLRDASI